jgi:hypothetical protein
MLRASFPRTLLGFVLACCLQSELKAQEIAFSVATDVATPDGFALKNELHRFGAQGRVVALPVELLNLYVGDVDGDGVFDDGPTDFDAAHYTGDPGCKAFLLSTTASFVAPGGVTVLDGDVFRFNETGVEVLYPEAFFASVTGTTGIDVDAFAVGPLGEIYFSFAEDEATSIPSLIAANGGQATIDEQCVFRLDAGSTTAVLHLTQTQVVAIFNAACGTNATSVVDVQGVDIDPAHPGELLLTSASSSAAIRGRVVTTFGGGQIFLSGGLTVEPSNMDFATPTPLDALAIVWASPTPVARTPQQTFSVATTGTGSVQLRGFQPGELVRVAVTDVVGARPPFTSLAGFLGFAQTPLDLASPVLALSFAAPEFLLQADAFGSAQLTFSVFGLPPYVKAVVQAVGTTSLQLSTPSAISFVP